jgi:hypothetical protein
MVQLFKLYFLSLFKPTEFAANSNVDELPSVTDFIWCSWPFAILQAIYSVGAILLGLGVVTQFEREYGASLLSAYISWGDFYLKKWMILSIIVSVILFPLVSWVYVKFWKVFVLFFAQLFNIDSDDRYDDWIENSVAATLSSNILMVFPFIGSLLKKISFVIIFFIHLNCRLGFSRYQSVVVILGPFLLIGIFLVLISMTIGVYLNLI